MPEKFVGGVRSQLSVISYQLSVISSLRKHPTSPHPTPHTPSPHTPLPTSPSPQGAVGENLKFVSQISKMLLT
ncbi:MAG: hypothetical protein EWV75_10015 [Microcystis wesenbergii Mw_QC_S_20081001_S30D]|uniref:Uncharacterized protein n=1 Tax=Microcystis wesenbergii Mw_QC_S_20081001_S30D TaxID=2486245 RepID=A0A552JN79_9CHRO|nr:MAG: hypothetical protein EWV75_10015 [Microcystis wesenbergii Mw_QC_S_20081001_S30D]TRU97131.1 MAG: hypothetical protein EWV74_18045 [Microcystis wesenbergii Mw_QC_S_20081001_S30]